MAQFRKLILSAILIAGCALNSATAALLDLTDSVTIASLSAITPVGSVNGFAGTTADGLGFELTSADGEVNFRQRYDGSLRTECLTPSGGGTLACIKDGAGIDNDEVTGKVSGGQTLKLEFATDVVISGFHFLDLYVNPADRNLDPDDQRRERATVSIDGDIHSIGAAEFGGQGGHAYLDLLSLATPVVGRTILFTANPDSKFWDDHDNDYAFAAIEVSPVPLPAAVWLFGSALIGLAGLGRRRQAV